MNESKDFRGRQSIRLKRWNYSSPHFYFVTLCAQNRECMFGEIENGEMSLNKAGKMVKEEWEKLSSRFAVLELDGFIIMPNHIHAILHIVGRGESCIRPESYIFPRSAIHSEDQGDHKERGEHEVRPYGTASRSVGRIIQAYKSITTRQYIQQMKNFLWPEFQKRLWQRNYFEHIIRNKIELRQTREYIRNNPAEWQNDVENPHSFIL